MQSLPPIVAIVGSARPQVVGAKEGEARAACNALGRELAQAGWKIAVYSDDTQFIEQDVVQGYVSSGTAAEASIVVYYPQGHNIKFAEMNNNHALFRTVIDPSDDWEVSFYRSLTKVDGLLALGGASSTVIAGHIALTRDLPVVAVAAFDGGGRKLWQYLSSQSDRFDENDVQAMATWNDQSAKDCVASLVRQHERRIAKSAAEQNALSLLKAKAAKWEENLAGQHIATIRAVWMVSFLVVFLVLLITGLTLTQAGILYTTIIFLGLCAAGGLGATARMLTAAAPQEANQLTAPILGIVVGFILSLLYLVPQLIGAPSFLVPDSVIAPATRVQYISALLIAFLAGLAFDYAVEQLLGKARTQIDEATHGSS